MKKLAPLPHSIDAERAVIGGLMLAPERLAEVADWLKAADFYRRDHAILFQAITEQAAAGKPVDPVTLAEWLESVELGDHVGGLPYLVELAQTTPSAANVTAYAEIVTERARFRRLAELGGNITQQALEPNGRSAAEIAAESESLLRTITPATSRGGLQPIHAALRSAFAQFSARYEGRGVLGLPFPWADLSAKVHLVSGETTVLAGRPSMGKSIMGVQTALSVAQAGKRVAIFSIETQAVGVVNRMLACSGSVPHWYILRPDPDRDDLMPRLTDAMRALDSIGGLLHVDESPSLTVSQIAARARRAHMHQPLDLIMVDHLHEIRLPRKNPKAEELGEAFQELRALARDLRVPVLCLAQLNRAAANDKRRPTLADLKASGDIEQVADVVLLIHRPDYYDHGDRPGLLEVEVAKARDGERGVVVNLRNDFAYMRALEWRGPIPSAEPARRVGFGKRAS